MPVLRRGAAFVDRSQTALGGSSRLSGHTPCESPVLTGLLGEVRLEYKRTMIGPRWVLKCGGQYIGLLSCSSQRLGFSVRMANISTRFGVIMAMARYGSIKIRHKIFFDL
jgi:hypothetical protein